MAVDLHDQPRDSYFSYDITGSGYDMKEPYIPRRRGVGPAEILMFLVVVGLCVPLITWFAMAVARLWA